MIKNRLLPFLLIACAPLAACSTITNGSTQLVKIKTVGTDDAYCSMQIGENDFRYVARPPQSMYIQRSKSPLYINCNAPGNRSVDMKVSSTVAENTYWNVFNAGTGAAYDAASGALYEWPDEIVIDFTQSFAKEQPLPAYENRGALDPRNQGIEYLGPDTPVLPGDSEQALRYKAAYADAAREEAAAAAADAERERRIQAVEGGFYGDKGGAAPRSTQQQQQRPSSGNEVQITPLSEAAPSGYNTPSNTSREGVIIPQASPQLGKPIFPQSTTFNR